jgi:aerobic-type carbon monoxide dehydrogenase small subunit (CoxS/CutS family)
MRVTLIINGKKKSFNIPPNRTLIDLLRAQGFWSVKYGCETGECGTCTVIVNGLAVNSCMILAVQADGKSIETYESLSLLENLTPLREALVELSTLQCGYCVPGMFISLKALLDKNPMPSEEEIRDAIAGNLCPCTNNAKPIEAITEAVKKMRGEW